MACPSLAFLDGSPSEKKKETGSKHRNAGRTRTPGIDLKECKIRISSFFCFF